MVQGNTAEALAGHTDFGGCHEDWHSADIICGGFPCQDISNAGGGTGITGTRSGLWAYLCGAFRLVRPLYGVVENVAALLSNGMDTVLGDLAEIGYDAEWHCIPAARVNLPIVRDRAWIIAYPDSVGLQGGAEKPPHPGITEQLQRLLPPRVESDVSGYLADGAHHGLSGRVDREAIKALGNTVVPQIPELIGRAIVASAR